MLRRIHTITPNKGFDKSTIQDSLLEEDAPAPIKEREVDMKYLHLYCLALGLCNMQNGWAIAGSNQSQFTIAT